tara:strand:- start:326 stop:1207 length:882 start_codon:yes stop_codon:yes gene_type:complete
MDENLISVIIPVYNRFTRLSLAIESVISQETDKFCLEILVINDGSTDGDYSFFEQNYNNVKVLHQNNNGVSSARNLGIKNAQGQWLFFLDSDDQWIKNTLLKRLNYLINNDAVIISGGHILFKDGILKKSRPYQKSKNILKTILYDNRIGTSSVGINRTFLKRENLFNTEFTIKEDWLAWISILSNHDKGIILSDKIFYKYEEEDSITYNKKTFTHDIEQLLLLSSYLKLYISPIHSEYKSMKKAIKYRRLKLFIEHNNFLKSFTKTINYFSILNKYTILSIVFNLLIKFKNR